MGEILVGTSSWADRSLVASKLYYPPEVKTAEDRLKYYSSEFPIAELDASYHYFPTRRNLEMWLENTPPGFTFDIRAFSIFTGHPTQPQSLPRSLREAYHEISEHKGSLYLHHLPEAAADQLWTIFGVYAGMVRSARKLGVILFQFPPWFHPGDENYAYIEKCCERFSGFRLAIEFRTGSWLEGETLNRTMKFLRDRELSLVCVDEPQGLPSSVPPVWEVTSKVAVVRFHGRNAGTWEKKGIPPEERFNYFYSEDEMHQWVPKVRKLSESAEKVHVIFKNKHLDYPVKNARRFRKMLAETA